MFNTFRIEFLGAFSCRIIGTAAAAAVNVKHWKLILQLYWKRILKSHFLFERTLLDRFFAILFTVTVIYSQSKIVCGMRKETGKAQ